jgi:hypothetical protein
MYTVALLTSPSARKPGYQLKICLYELVPENWRRSGLALSCCKNKFQMRLGNWPCRTHGRSTTCSTPPSSSMSTEIHRLQPRSPLIKVIRSMRLRLLLPSARWRASSSTSLDGRIMGSSMTLGNRLKTCKTLNKKLKSGSRRHAVDDPQLIVLCMGMYRVSLLYCHCNDRLSVGQP